ncbi:MAG TPA: hypothetical protein VFB79_11315 [Candidatus Angelobacter sp.]|nr:hypothetical protein [Candidatus Angelobacter sp.]
MLLLKIIIAPILIGLVSLAGRKWGPGISGWLLGLPVNAAPILLFITLQQGHPFAAAAAYGSLLGLTAWAFFCLVYSFCCPYWPWWASTLAGWTAYCATGLILMRVHLRLGWIFALTVMAISVILFVLFPQPAQERPVQPRPGYELWLRMITATVMVLVLTGVAAQLGPQRSGILTVFPVYTSILAIFSHVQSAGAAVKVLRGVTLGLYTMAVFCATLSIFLVRFSALPAFLLSLGAASVIHAMSLVFMRRGAKA